MNLQLSKPKNSLLNAKVTITGSKSETNRLLLLQSVFPSISVGNISNSDDAQVMQRGLATAVGEVDIHHAGTAMRFLTSYFASTPEKDVLLTGSKRMKERPIQVLVEALRSLGADIAYGEKEGYPPLKIKGKQLPGGPVSLPANISSQYISSLLLIAPTLKHGLELELVGKITSVPYIEMTLSLLDQLGIKTHFEGNRIKVHPKTQLEETDFVVESDWSAASYFYSIVAMAEVGSEISLSSYKKDSLQGDSVLAKIYTQFGVETTFLDHSIRLKKIALPEKEQIECELSNAPDIAQTIAVSCLGLGLGCHLTGLHTLPIKETDRLAAMKTELEKFGATVKIDHESLTLSPSGSLKENQQVDTYNDHRMAMAFAPLALKVGFTVNDAMVVSKSYPDFWNDLAMVGFGVAEV